MESGRMFICSYDQYLKPDHNYVSIYIMYYAGGQLKSIHISKTPKSLLFCYRKSKNSTGFKFLNCKINCNSKLKIVFYKICNTWFQYIQYLHIHVVVMYIQLLVKCLTKY